MPNPIITGPAIALRMTRESNRPMVLATRSARDAPIALHAADQNIPTVAHVAPLTLSDVETLRAWHGAAVRTLQFACPAASPLALSMHAAYFAGLVDAALPVLKRTIGEPLALRASTAPPTIPSTLPAPALSVAQQTQLLDMRDARIVALRDAWPRATRPQCEAAVDARYPELLRAVDADLRTLRAVSTAFDELVAVESKSIARLEPELPPAAALAKATANTIARHPDAYRAYRKLVTVHIRR